MWATTAADIVAFRHTFLEPSCFCIEAIGGLHNRISVLSGYSYVVNYNRFMWITNYSKLRWVTGSKLQQVLGHIVTHCSSLQIVTVD